MSITPRKYNRAIQNKLSRSGSFDSLQNALQQRPSGLPIVKADDVLQGRVEIFERDDPDGPKPKYFHQNYLLVQNNGQSEYDVVARLLDALIVKEPSLLPEENRIMGNGQISHLTRSPAELFSYGYLPITNRDGDPIPRGDRPVPDETIVRFFDTDYYRWLFAVDAQGRYTFDIDNGDGLTPADFVAYQTAIAEARTKEDYRIVYDYWRKAHPRKLRGITQIPHGLRKHWASLLDHPDDIAIIMLSVSPALPKFNEHRLIIGGLGAFWTADRIKQVFSRYSSSKDNKYPVMKIDRTKNSDDPWRVEMSFDPSDHEGMFANLFLNAMSFIDADLRSRRRVNAHYAIADRNQRTNDSRSTAPAKPTMMRSNGASSMSQSAPRMINVGTTTTKPSATSSTWRSTQNTSTSSGGRGRGQSSQRGQGSRRNDRY